MSKLVLQFVRITLILAVIGGGYGNVICHGNDGHVAVEPVFHNHCSHGEDGHKHEDHAEYKDIQFRPAEQCSPCVDIFISEVIGPVRIQLLPLCDVTSLNAAVADAGEPLGAIYTFRMDVFAFFKPLKTIILLT